MKKIIITIMIMLFALPGFAQEIVNLILVGKDGVTEDIKAAESFIVIKQFPNGFQRLDYTLGGPLTKVRNYADTNLSVLNGDYYEYSLKGALTLSGYFINNTKEKDWYYYNDTGKVILEQKYENGILVKTINPDTLDPETLKKRDIGDTEPKDGEVEAHYKKGDRDWKDYLIKNLDHKAVEKSMKGGKVMVGFSIDTSGKCVDIHLVRSAEFVLDEEAIRMIENSGLWHPAIQDGKKVKAYRRQPLTFWKDED